MDGCKNWNGFNFEELKAKYCLVHKEDGMVDVKNKKTCIHEGCRTIPAFNIEIKTLYYMLIY